MKKTYKDLWQYILATLSFIFAFILALIGTYIEPLGQIHGSLISVISFFLALCAGIFGVSVIIKDQIHTSVNDAVKKMNKED